MAECFELHSEYQRLKRYKEETERYIGVLENMQINCSLDGLAFSNSEEEQYMKKLLNHTYGIINEEINAIEFGANLRHILNTLECDLKEIDKIIDGGQELLQKNNKLNEG